MTVIVAAGNSGPGSQTILSPGNSSSVITVGAVDDKRTPSTADDSIAPFSSRGPTREGLRKPDVVAPGVNIMSLSNSKLDGYASLSGTSMATPVVSGSAALILSKDNGLGPSELKSKLVNSCTDLKDKKDNQGAGIICLKKVFEDSSKNKKPSGPSKPSKPSKPYRPTPNEEQEEKKVANQGFGGEFIVILLFVLLILIRIV